jgi:hypothetical protein
MFSFFKRTPTYQGAFPDTRSKEEKAKDWQAFEVFSFGTPTFRTVDENGWKKYQVRNQDGSGSCVANSQAKFLEVMAAKRGDTIKFSHAPVYKKRANRPAAGMGFPDAPKLQVSHGTCREEQMPSENMSDQQLDDLVLPHNYEDINDYARPSGYVSIPQNFFDVASYVETHGAAIIWVDTDYKNWTKDIPTVGGKGGGVRHSVCAVDAVTFNGVKYLVIEDSWGAFGKYNGQRLITQDFFKDAVFMAYALTEFTYEPTTAKFEPFKTQMKFGQKSDEIKRLQQYLVAKGTFPANTQLTGYYGAITAQAVQTFQIKFNVDTPTTIYALKGKVVGPKTLAVINNNL